MSRVKRCNRSVVFVAILGFASIALPDLMSSALAQTAVTGGLSGVVTDSSGAIVPNATVTIVNTATRDTRVLTTNAEGRYVGRFSSRVHLQDSQEPCSGAWKKLL